MAVKQIFDRLAAASALLMLGPVLVAIALAIKLYDGGPVLSRQIRVGKDNRIFHWYRFRIVRADASIIKTAQNTPSVQAPPNLTPIGATLYRYSIDELPVLLNVLLGQMSLVGPRPLLPVEMANYDPYLQHYATVKPGVTGLWQLTRRRDLTWKEAVRLDMRYIENRSFVLDLLILLRTWRDAFRRGE
jgi:lipopolysaccharide/colanic/teichoic acid biosynthesis glycosyltransferase